MKNNSKFIWGVSLICLLGVGCKREFIEPIVEESTVAASKSSGKDGWNDVKSKLDKKITYHGQQRLAGPDATRGKVLSEKEAFNTKYNAIAKRTTFKQTNGPTVYLEKLPSGRYNGVVEGNYGLITTMKNWSARDLANMGKNQHWPEYEIKDLENSDY